MIKTIEQVKKEFIDCGKSIAEWSRDNNFPPDLVYRVLNNNRIPARGMSHKIAIKLGIKEAEQNIEK